MEIFWDADAEPLQGSCPRDGERKRSQHELLCANRDSRYANNKG